MYTPATKASAQADSTQQGTTVNKTAVIQSPEQTPLWADIALPIQFSLKVNTPGDKYEQEADRVSEQVMRMPEPAVQRKSCACGRPAGPDGMCEDCKRKRLGIQRMAKGEGGQTAVPPVVNQVVSQPGRPLDGPTRHFMESRFGQDFGGVRVHTGGMAATSAESVNASAYTVGSNIVFNQGQYQPQSAAGRRLLAHELVHVVQQSTLGQFQSGAMVQRRVVPRPCDRNPMIPCPPPPMPSPITSCSTRSHESVMIEVASKYIHDEIDSSDPATVKKIDCFLGIGACEIEFDSGVAVETALLLNPYTGSGGAGGTVFVKEIRPFLGKNTKPYTPLVLGPQCSYDVDCPNPSSLTITLRGCRPQKGEPFIDPGNSGTLAEDERYA